MSFSVTILGSGGAIPTARRNPSSQYVQCNDRHILIDCAEGTQMQLRRFGIKLQKIQHILITHLHGDHYFGLVGLISTMHLLGRNQGLTIYGPPELEEIVRRQLELGKARLEFDIKFVQLDGKSHGLIYEDRLIEIHYFPLKHRIPTNGYVIKEKIKERKLNSEAIKHSGLKLEQLPMLKSGKDVVSEDGKIFHFHDYTFPPPPSGSYAYCSDTMYWEPILAHVKNVSLLYHEATFVENEKDRAEATFHSTASQAAEIALKANAGKLILGHFSARYENAEQHLVEAKKVFENTVAAEDGEKIDVIR